MDVGQVSNKILHMALLYFVFIFCIMLSSMFFTQSIIVSASVHKTKEKINHWLSHLFQQVMVFHCSKGLVQQLSCVILTTITKGIMIGN